MGIYSRDYLREDYGPQRGGWTSIEVIKWLIIVNVAVFVLQVVWQDEFIRRYQIPFRGNAEVIEEAVDEINGAFYVDSVEVKQTAEGHAQLVFKLAQEMPPSVLILEVTGDGNKDQIEQALESIYWPSIEQVQIRESGDGRAELVPLQTYRGPVINEWLALDRSAIFGGQVWRLLTYEFLHGHITPWHLFFNMFLLYLAGRKVGDFYGARELLLFYLAAGVVSGVLSVFWYEGFGQQGWSAIGASGSVAAVFLLYALNWPFDTWRIWFFIPVQAMWIAIFVAIWDVFPMLLQIGGSGGGDGVAHSAHVGGMLFALLYQRRNWRLEPLVTRFRLSDWKRRLRPRGKLRVYQPQTEDIDWEGRVDELLQKVAEQGESSLTDAERKILVEASKRYQQRNH